MNWRCSGSDRGGTDSPTASRTFCIWSSRQSVQPRNACGGDVPVAAPAHTQWQPRGSGSGTKWQHAHASGTHAHTRTHVHVSRKSKCEYTYAQRTQHTGLAGTRRAILSFNYHCHCMRRRWRWVYMCVASAARKDRAVHARVRCVRVGVGLNFGSELRQVVEPQRKRASSGHAIRGEGSVWCRRRNRIRVRQHALPVQ